jgi:hypothetical protein
MTLHCFALPPYLRSKSGRNPTSRSLSATTTKRTTSGESTLTGAMAEERLIVTKNSPAKYDECDSCLLNYYIAKFMKKVTGCVAKM